MPNCKFCVKPAYYKDLVGTYCGQHKTVESRDTRHCRHGKQKSFCKECGGSQICEHGKNKSMCKECGGSQICEHGKNKSMCKECGGGHICEHGRQRSVCKECGGSQICEHGRIRGTCKECGGSQICEHDKQRSMCKECGGSQICEHDKVKFTCVICTPKNACQNCKYNYVPPRYRFKPYCFNCYCVLNPNIEIPRRYKTKEYHMRDALKEIFPETEMVFDKKVECGCSARRPDVLIDQGFPIVIECDENRHGGYSCENKRTMQLFQDLGNRPVRFVRFNPDSYQESGVRYNSCFKSTANGLTIDKKEWNNRIKILKEVVEKLLLEVPEKEVSIMHLFFGDSV